MDAAAALESRARDGDFTDDIAFARYDLADRPGEEFGNPIADVRSDNKQHAVPEAAVFDEVRFKGEDFGGGEWAS